MKTFRKGGIHPDPCKITADVPTRAIPAPEVYTVLLSQNIGAPARPVVKPGDMVKQGDLLAEAGGFVSANIHSPADATVKKIEKVRNFKGLRTYLEIVLWVNLNLRIRQSSPLGKHQT